MEQAARPDLHKAIGQDRLEESAQTLDGVAMRRTEAGTAHLTGGERHRAVREAHDAAMGDGDPADRGGKGGAGGVSVRIGLPGDVPGDGPHVGGEVLPPSSLAHLVCDDGAGDGGEGVAGDKDVGAGGHPWRAVLCEAPTGPKGREVRVGLQWPAPRRQATRAPREVGPDAPRVFGEPFEGERCGVDQGVGGEAWLGAEKGAQGLRDRAGEEAVRPWELWVQVMMEPLLGCMVRARGPVAVATGMMAAVVPPPALALREAVARGPAWAMSASADALAGHSGEGGRVLQGRWGAGLEAVTQGGHGRRPCMRALRRS